MSNNNTLPEDLQATIKDAAETYAGLKAWIDKDGMEPQLFYEYIAAQSHIAGATEYAPYKLKYEQARIILKDLLDTFEAGAWPDVPSKAFINEIKSFLDGSK